MLRVTFTFLASATFGAIVNVLEKDKSLVLNENSSPIKILNVQTFPSVNVFLKNALFVKAKPAMYCYSPVAETDPVLI